MPLTRLDVCTLVEAAVRFGLSDERRRAVASRLDGRELRHLGYQDERGWFYRVDDIYQALEQTDLAPLRIHQRGA